MNGSIQTHGMAQTRKPLWRRATPVLLSGVSTVYALARAHQLSRREASEATLVQFLLEQSDVLLVLCGNHAIWYVVARRRNRELPASQHGLEARTIRQLRQVLSALMLGIGLLERRIGRGACGELGTLAARLHMIVRQGAQLLATLEGEHSNDLFPPVVAPHASHNGHAPV